MGLGRHLGHRGPCGSALGTAGQLASPWARPRARAATKAPPPWSCPWLVTGTLAPFRALLQHARATRPAHPPLSRAIGASVTCTTQTDGSAPLVLLTACANAVAEEMFFRGALWWSVVEGVPPPRQDHPRLRRHHRHNPQPRARSCSPGPPQASFSASSAAPPAASWHHAPHPPHVVAPHAALPPAPGIPTPRPPETTRA